MFAPPACAQGTAAAGKQPHLDGIVGAPWQELGNLCPAVSQLRMLGDDHLLLQGAGSKAGWEVDGACGHGGATNSSDRGNQVATAPITVR